MRISDWSSDVCSSDLVVVTFKDGSTLEEEIAVADAHPRGAHPFAGADYITKFRSLTDGLVEPTEAERFLAAAAALASSEAAGLDAITVAVPDDQDGRASCRERGVQYG